MIAIADPAGIFPTDAHRRVLAHLPVPGDDPLAVEDLLVRMHTDDPTDFTETDQLLEVLDELGEGGDASESKAGWRQTKAGFGKLTGPIANEPPPLEGAALEAEEARNAELAAKPEAAAAREQEIADKVAVYRAELEAEDA
jgi:hypothetical protein